MGFGVITAEFGVRKHLHANATNSAISPNSSTFNFLKLAETPMQFFGNMKGPTSFKRVPLPRALFEAGLKVVGLKRSGLKQLSKSNSRKDYVAYELATRTSVNRAWIADKLCMGKPTTICRMIRMIPKVREKLAQKDAEMLSYQESVIQFITWQLTLLQGGLFNYLFWTLVICISYRA